MEPTLRRYGRVSDRRRNSTASAAGQDRLPDRSPSTASPVPWHGSRPCEVAAAPAGNPCVAWPGLNRLFARLPAAPRPRGPAKPPNPAVAPTPPARPSLPPPAAGPDRATGSDYGLSPASVPVAPLPITVASPAAALPGS